MSVIGEVFGSLKSMSQVQLLLAFIACIGYAFAQGSLLPSRGRYIAWGAAALSAAAFAFLSADWTHAAMLLGFAVAGMGSFVALVWLTSRAIGFGRPTVRNDAAPAESGFDATAVATQPRAARASEPIHSV